MLLAPVNTMMHDISRILELLFQFGMFLAPTVYPTPVLHAVDSSWQTILYLLHNLNPVTHFLDGARSLVEHGALDFGPGFLVSTVLSFLVFATGWRFFHVCEPLLAERL